MSEASAASVLLWWVLLLASVTLILREMIGWLRRRTADLKVWADAPRVEPPLDEVAAVARLFESLSRDPPGRLTIGRTISDAVIDRVSLTLQMDRLQLRALSRNDDLVKKAFGKHAAITDYFSENWIVKTLSSGAAKRPTPKSRVAGACLEETKSLFEEIGRWEKEYEGSRGI